MLSTTSYAWTGLQAALIAGLDPVGMTVVSIFLDKFKLSRRVCCLLVLGISLALGVPSALGYSAWSGVSILKMSILDFFDFTTNSLIMPIVALITCVFVGFVLTPKRVIEEVELPDENGKPYHVFKWKGLFSVVIRYIAPICILIILLSSILGALGVMKI